MITRCFRSSFFASHAELAIADLALVDDGIDSAFSGRWARNQLLPLAK